MLERLRSEPGRYEPRTKATGSRTATFSATAAMVAQLVALRPGPTRWFHHDALGSTRALSNASGAVVGTFTYGP